MGNMKRILSSLPIWLVLADMLYGFSANVAQSLSVHQRDIPNDGLPVAPEIAFDGLQVLANGGMVLVIGFGLLVLLRLNRTVLRNQVMRIGVFSTLGLVAVLAFSVPAIWEWLTALWRVAQGQKVVSFDNPRYLVTAFCLPWIAVVCLSRLRGWYRLNKLFSQQQTTVSNFGVPSSQEQQGS